MTAKRILILVGDYSEDYEVMCSYVALKAAGHTVDAVAPGKPAGATIRTSVHEFEFPEDDNYSEKPGHKFTLTATFDDIRAEDYDAVLCPGGRGAEYIRRIPAVVEAVRHFAEADKPMASICNGLQVYTDAGVVEGRRCTGYPDSRLDAIRAGADWQDVEITRGLTEDRAVVDGNLVTAATWACLPSMLSAFLELLSARVEARA